MTKALIQALPLVGMIVSSGRDVLYVNPRGEASGVRVGEKCYKTFAGRDDSCPWCRADEVVSAGREARAEAWIGRSAWDMRWVGIDGDRFAHFGTDVTDRALDAEQLRKRLDAEKVLLGEMSHRTRNVLALIESMLRLNGMAEAGEEKKEALLDAAGRVRILSRIQDILAGGGTSRGSIHLRPFLEDLFGNLTKALGRSARQVAIAIEGADCWIEADHAIPCGLIVNELVTNAIKHAFPTGRGGKILVSAKCAADLVVTVEDNGVGLPQGIDPGTTTSFGLSIVCALSRQIRGELSVVRGAGTKFVLTVHPPDVAA